MNTPHAAAHASLRRPADIIVFSRPSALALFGERTVTPPPRPADPCALWQYVRRVRATYLVTGPDSLNQNAKYVARFVDEFAPHLREVMRNADVAVYRVESAPDSCIERLRLIDSLAAQFNNVGPSAPNASPRVRRRTRIPA
jgi:hypothetical protein